MNMKPPVAALFAVTYPAMLLAGAGEQNGFSK